MQRHADLDCECIACYIYTYHFVVRSKVYKYNMLYTVKFTEEGADKILDYYRVSKGAFLCIQKNKRILHYGYIIKQSL